MLLLYDLCKQSGTLSDVNNCARDHGETVEYSAGDMSLVRMTVPTAIITVDTATPMSN